MKYIKLLFLTFSIGCSSNKIVRSKEKKIESNIKVISNETTHQVEDEKEVSNKLAINFTKAELLSEVLEKAKMEKKWVYVDIGAKWCLPCKIMKRDVYSNIEAVKILNNNFISYLVDVENGEGPDLKLIFEINSYPTLLFIDSKGRVKLRKETALTVTGLVEFAKEALTIKNDN